MSDTTNLSNDELAVLVHKGFGPYDTRGCHDALWELVQRAGVRTVECPTCGEEFDCPTPDPKETS